MIFTSWLFAGFIIVVSLIYFPLGRRWQWQNVLLLVASYISYGFFDWRFLTLLAGMTGINYLVGWAIAQSFSTEKEGGVNRRRSLLGIAIIFDLCVLVLFKYFNFFYDSLVSVFSTFGLIVDPVNLTPVLPIGLSFFTFMALTYPFDIYRQKITHTKRFLDFALFVSFFPTVVSGPVERAEHMLPQFQRARRITTENINEGLWLIIWGLFQKMVIADNVGWIVNRVYSNYTHFEGLDITIAIFAYTIQILADFGGYTDIARGVARFLGFDIFLNFNVPYFAINPRDFWSRWHISLSSWFRDYLYIPLGGNRKGKWRTNLNLLITMILVGLWHGAAWTFVVWGAWHGLLQVIYRLFGEKGQDTDRTIRGWTSALSLIGRTVLMVVLVAAGWAVFRATSFDQVAYLFTHFGFGTSTNSAGFILRLFCFTLPLVIVQIIQLRTKNPTFMARMNPSVRGLAYGLMLVSIMIFSQRVIPHFIYQGF